MKTRLFACLLLVALMARAEQDFFTLCLEGTSEQIQEAIAAGAKANATNEFGSTPLMLLVRGRLEAVPTLLKAGADVNARDKAGMTVLMWAIRDSPKSREQDDPAFVNTLLTAGAQINRKDRMGRSALDFARDAKRQSVVETLIRAGAKRGCELATDDDDEKVPPWALPPPALQKTYLQPVPSQIANAYCDYRGRMWYTVFQPTWTNEGCCPREISLAASIKAQVEKQWAGDQSVVIKGGEIALFEPGGRVWIRSGAELLGYDGKSWLRGRMDGMDAVGAGHGRRYEQPSAWVVGGRCFFSATGLSEQGITCFEGDRWVPLDVVNDRQHWWFWRMAGLRDGTGLVALNSGVCLSREKRAWIYRWGRWNRLALPAAQLGFDIAVDKKNNLLIQTSEGIVSWPLGHAAEMKDEELRKLVGNTEPPITSKVTSIGQYQLGNILSFSQEHNGTILMVAESMRSEDRELGGGLLIIDPGGSARFVANPVLASARSFFLTLDGRRIVVQGENYPHRPCGVIDLGKEKPEYQPFDIPDLDSVQCAGSDGRYYVRNRQGQDLEMARVLFALDPTQRDGRDPVPAVQVELQSVPYCVASDGRVWAAIEGKGLSRLVDKDWQVLLPLGDSSLWIKTCEDGLKLRKEQVRALWPGAAGTVLAVLHDKTVILFDGDRQTKAKSVRDLVTDNPVLIAACFSTNAPVSMGRDFGVTSDKKGNIYVQEDRTNLNIYLAAARRWEAVPNYDSLRVPQVYGDGSKVLLFKDDHPYEATSAAPTELVRSRIAIKDIPLVTDTAGGLFVLEDRTTGPWRESDYRLLHRMGAQAVEIAQTRAMPRAFDPAGVLWCERFDYAAAQGSKPCRLLLFKADKPFQEIELPEGEQEGMCIVPSVAGSVYIWTTLGLRHYVLDRDQKRYALDRSYRVVCNGMGVKAGVNGKVAGNFLVYSAGFSSGSLDSSAAIIYLVPLPK